MDHSSSEAADALPSLTRKEWQNGLLLTGLTSEEQLLALSSQAMLTISKIKAAMPMAAAGKGGTLTKGQLPSGLREDVVRLRDDACALRQNEDQFRQRQRQLKQQQEQAEAQRKQQQEEAEAQRKQQQEEAAARRLQRERTLREQEEKAIEMAKAMTAASQAAEDAVARAAAAEAAAAKEANHAVHALELAAAEVEFAEEKAERAAERAVRAEGLLASQESPSFALRRQSTMALTERNNATLAAASWAEAQEVAIARKRQHALKKEERKQLEAIMLKWNASSESREVAAAAASGKIAELFGSRLRGKLFKANEGRMATLIQRKYRGRSKTLQHQIRASLLGRVPPGAAEVYIACGLDGIATLLSETLGANVWLRAIHNAPDAWEEEDMLDAMSDAIRRPAKSPHVRLLALPTKFERALQAAYIAAAGTSHRKLGARSRKALF